MLPIMVPPLLKNNTVMLCGDIGDNNKQVFVIIFM